MLPCSLRLWSTPTFIPVIFLPAFITCAVGGEPYIDRHFNLDSSPRNGSATVSTMLGGYTDGMASGTGCAACSTGAAGGSASGICRAPKNTILQLWVPDELRVKINGRSTKPQTLAGIHEGSRFFILVGLEANRVSPCEIVVETWDYHGNIKHFRRSLPVQAGGKFEVRFPDGFQLISAPKAVPIEATIQSESVLLPVQGVIPAPQTISIGN